MPSRDDNLLVRAVARVPTTVNRKLLVAFVGTVGLLVIVGLLGLRVLGDSNDRVTTLGDLQKRLASYRELKTYTGQVQLLLALRVGGSDTNVYIGAAAPTLEAPALVANDEAIGSTIKLMAPFTDAVQLGFTPPPDEKSLLTQIALEFGRFSAAMNHIAALDLAKNTSDARQVQVLAEGEANNLERLANQLVTRADTTSAALIAQNQSNYSDSQRLFMAVASASVVLALGLGLVLSWSLMGPIKRMSARLSGIASGDFSDHVEVSNRDELGALATNLNRMNDELGRLYRELESASRHKSEFLANMSHELRTPLNAVIGFSQVLKERMFGDLNPKQAEYVDDILISGQHLLSLINDILDLAKVEAGRMELEADVFPLAATVQTAIAMVRERATRQGVTVSTDLDSSVELIQADERKVRQILFNLLTNAVKFTGAGGRVMVTASACEDHVELSVSDTGVGIKPEDLAEIFEPFRQVGPGRAQEGTGLGLPLVKQLIELHGSELHVSSVPGEGSTFTFTLPLHQRSAVPETALSHLAVTG